MQINSTHIAHLVHAVVNEDASPQQINELVRSAHHLAVTRVKQLVGSGKLHLQSFPLAIESIAFDCIAELFARNDDAQFVELRDYFTAEHSLRLLNAEEILQQFRMLVFSTLHDGIFRLYRENDPILSKIIRNIKLAVQKEPSIHEVERFGMIYLMCSSMSETNEHLPEFDLDELERSLGGKLTGEVNAHSYLKSVFAILREQNTYRRSLSLIDIAVVLKRFMFRNSDIKNAGTILDINLTTSDTQAIITTSIAAARNDLFKRYVAKGKIREDQFERYFSAIHEMLEDTFIRNDGNDQSYFEYLSHHMNGLKNEVYRNDHRIHFEYMVKLAKNIVKKNLKELV